MTPDFGLLTGSCRVQDDVAHVQVDGEIDLASVATFRDLLAQGVAAGVPRMVVDMSQVSFCDGQGLTALMAASDQQAAHGGVIEVRQPSARVHRLLELTGLLDALHAGRPLGSSQLVGDLARVVGVPFARDVLNAALRMVVTMAQAVVVGADGVSITLPRNGLLGTVAASNQVVLDMDHDQYDTQQGPCLDAATNGHRFLVTSLENETRWPEFVPRARARGIESILSTPLMDDDRSIGALNIYSRTVGAFEDHENEWADQFAAEAASLVTRVEAGTSADSLSERLQDGLASREVIALAQGVVMHRDGVSRTAAYSVLKDESRRTSLPLFDVCEQLVSSQGAIGGAHGRSSP